MPNVTMPNGDVVSFPDDMPKEQIRGLITKKFPETAPQEPQNTAENGGFIEGVKQSALKRAENYGNIMQSDEPTAGKAYLALGESAGLANDVMGEAIGAVTPDVVKQYLAKAAQGVFDTVGNLPSMGGGTIGERIPAELAGIEKNHPRFTQYAKATANLGAVLPASRIATSKPVVDTTLEAGKVAARGGLVAASAAGDLFDAGVKAVGPKLDDAAFDVASLAKKHGIPLRMDQITDSRALRNIQKVSQELPFSGAEKFRDKQLSQWQKALMKEVGESAEKITPSVMNRAFKRVGAQFDNFTKGKNFEIGDAFRARLDEIRADSPMLYTKEASDAFEQAVKEIEGNVRDGILTGNRMSYLRSRMNKMARTTKIQGADELFHDLENVLIDTISESAPEAAQALKTAKYQYKNLIAIEPLAQKAVKGQISAPQLSTRAARIYGRAYTTGEAGPLGELARVGKELLPELGGSDTLQKSVYTAGALGAGSVEPLSVGSVLAGNRAYQAGFNTNQGMVDSVLRAQTPQPLLSQRTKSLLRRQMNTTP